MTTTDRYTIKLTQFEGPFDLLLFFIERDELDIYDIPIAKITKDFLDYIRQMQEMNVDVASEFILVAATLMRIKARILIPRKEVDEEGNEIDPRMELVERLLEYKRYKSVLAHMRTFEEERALMEKRGYANKEIKEIAVKALVDVELESLTLFKLMKAFQRVLDRMEGRKSKVIHQVYTYNHTIRGQQKVIRELVGDKRVPFETIFGELENRMHAIINFMALLELLNRLEFVVIQGEGVNNFWIEKNPDAPDDVPQDIAKGWDEEAPTEQGPSE
ncbi:MAG TPA: chromosome segregation protein ScpA [Saprospiraceae bacterium]|nr:chromosome segregation protein ScpA [Saprospiraceae bacterium]